MAKSSNASPEMFGFDFQVNATIVLLLDNIKNVKTVRMEGASEDIELTMNDGKHIMAQAKATVKGSSDSSNARSMPFQFRLMSYTKKSLVLTMRILLTICLAQYMRTKKKDGRS